MKSNIEKVKFYDKIASSVIRTSGFFVIACVIAIIVFIVQVSLPLFFSAESKGRVLKESYDQKLLLLGVDDYGENVFLLSAENLVIQVSNIKEDVDYTLAVSPPYKNSKKIIEVQQIGRNVFCFVWDDFSINIKKLKSLSEYNEAGDRKIRLQLEEIVQWENLNKNPNAVTREIRVAYDQEEHVLTIIKSFDGIFEISSLKSEENFMGELEVVENSFTLRVDSSIGPWIVSQDGKQLVWIDLLDVLHLSVLGNSAIRSSYEVALDFKGSSLSFNYGDASFIVGGDSGGISAWMLNTSSKKKGLVLFHSLPGLKKPISEISHNYRDKSFLSQDENGYMLYTNLTSESIVFISEVPVKKARMSAKGNLIVAQTETGELFLWEIEKEFPSVTLKTLFSKMWYEGYSEPEYVWQSSASSSDYEAKLSLIPLIFGSLKSTFYALIFAIPLSVFAAIYISQFASPVVKNLVKPIIEFMAAVPSVVVGLLAAIWLAPLIDAYIGAFFLYFIIFPLAFILFLILWEYLKGYLFDGKLDKGIEFIIILPVFILSLALAVYWGVSFENLVFDGSFQEWLFHNFKTQYTQRNSVIIAFALGFTVIPIVFTMSEDSLSNVPSGLSAASLALGATRWQTVSRVVVWSASPGILAGIMIGFGRAVGETMIVLMATGNTPILEMSPFNGMRTLAATIAVEIPEAPDGGDLYRTLFFSAVILFILTFALNTCAEFVRHNLRKKYGSY